MSFTGWYVPKSGTSKNKPQIRISKNFISISRHCIENYFRDKTNARIGYDEENNRLLIMPATPQDKLSLALIGKKDANFQYVNARNFIEEAKLAPPSGEKSKKYECTWDDENKWLVVEHIKK